ncbi:Ank2 [Symbiodinium sp. CCMP2592]|nr:Ank2 [Symbiodinium sp. CCMP2592]
MMSILGELSVIGIRQLSPHKFIRRDVVTSVSPELLADLVGDSGKPVIALKRHLQAFCGHPRFRQQLVRESGVALQDDDQIEGPAELQLVLLPFRKITKALAKECFRHATKNSVSNMERLLNQPVDPDIRDTREGEATLLCLSCHHGFDEITRLLLEAQADPDKCLPDGAGALFLACRGAHVDAVRLLIEARATPDLPEHGQAVPLQVSAAMGLVETTRLLLDARADASKKSIGADGRPESAFLKAATGGHVELVRLMVEEYELDKAEAPEAAGGALFMACMKNHVETASFLLEARAHPDRAYEVPGTTPLAIAAKEGHMEALRLLLRAGADLNLPTPTGVTPLVAASAYGQHDAVVLLLENLAQIHKTAGNGMSPLLGACKHGRFRVVNRLLTYGADIHQAMRDEGETPFWMACRSGNINIVKELLEAKADMNTPNNSGVTPLQIAKEMSHADLVVFLEALVMDEGASGVPVSEGKGGL